MLEGYPVVVRQAVVWGEMDAYRHVNNTVYFRYFENARLEYFRRLRWFEYEDETGIGPILAATQARFRRPLTYPDTISIGARITDIGTTSVFAPGLKAGRSIAGPAGALRAACAICAD